MHEKLMNKLMKAKCLALLLSVALYHGWIGIAMASEAEPEHHHPLNWFDFGCRTLAFVIVVGFLVYVLRKPVANFLNSRREEIQRLLAELEAKTSEAKAEYARVQSRVASLEEETRKIVDELISEGEVEKEKIIQSARREAEYIQQQAQIAIEQEIQAARAGLKEEMAELSITAAQDLIKKKIKAEDQHRLAKEFMTQVVEAK